ncbi:MAG: 2-phosphosulfolactate phosphatase [Armatimonadota bacterium]|nr:2-phosphosulfolactate phosphatase [Armatimonadota bacterium]MDR7452167.1 2-phosphosulfolactate phosphatase [Armatimonadota bacterium]MDR7468066.1 2-phosphosulfolactate phosphatase [Armatimonadota bacterium]MDR7494893.1 2-phosphosulfolactate phosphatase [Armatimonadota bacterium]MDR7500290.1 2-phosphosulfolactate phosphatase [Armatimonadota bacterium]
MRLHVAFHPSLLLTGALDPAPVDRPQVCVVVDVLRASTSLVTLVERGADGVYIAPSVAVARARKGELPRVVMAGEEGGLAPEGFDYGNSPVELAAAEIRGRPVIFVTTNGTAAIRAVAGLGPVLIGAMRNGAAAAAEAFRLARAAGSDVTLVCAGREGGFGLDDAYCAGYLTSRLLEHGPFDLTDGAEAALLLYRSEPDTLAVFLRAAAGRNIVRLGLQADVSYCARRDCSSVVPTVGRELRLVEETVPGERRQ